MRMCKKFFQPKMCQIETKHFHIFMYWKCPLYWSKAYIIETEKGDFVYIKGLFPSKRLIVWFGEG